MRCIACVVLLTVRCTQAIASPTVPLRCSKHILLSAAAAPLAPAEPIKAPPTSLLMVIAGLQSGCFGCIGTALPPALRAAGLQPAEVALLLGRLGSAAALCEVLLSGSFGSLADAIGRKPILVAAPAITVLARSLVVFRPTLPVLLGARLVRFRAVQ